MKNDLIYLKASLNNLVLINLHLRLIKIGLSNSFCVFPRPRLNIVIKTKLA